MTDHQPKTAALLAYEDGLLSPKGRVRVERHLQGCNRCRGELAAIRAYAGVTEEARDLPAPAVDWEAVQRPVAAEARRVARRARWRRRGPVAAGVSALAAAALLAWWLGGEPTAPVSPPGEGLAESPAPAPEPEPQPAPAAMRAEVMAIAGEVSVAPASGERRALRVGERLAEGARLHTGEVGVAHLRLATGTGFVVGPETALTLTGADTGAVELALRGGLVSSEVAPDGAPERYEVRAGEYRVRVAGTRFAVRKEGAAVGVRVDRGAVEVLRGGAVVRVIRAPGTWSTADPARPPEAAVAPRGLGPEAAEWPVLRLSSPSRVRSWEVTGTAFEAAGKIAVRVPEGPLELVAVDRQGRRHTLPVEVGMEGAELSEARLRRLLPEPVGHLPPEEIKRALGEVRPALQSCYERAMRRDPDLRGRYQLTVRVGRSGVVQSSRMTEVGEGAEPPAGLTECVDHILRRRPFPQPTGGPVTFQAPLSFRAVSGN